MATILKPLTSLTTDFGKIAMPIYVGFNNDTAKHILDCLRRKVTDPQIETSTGLGVVHHGITHKQQELEARLRIDLNTLRFVLFDSMSRGLMLDLVLRIQEEIKDEFQFIDSKVLKKAFDNTMDVYNYYAKPKD